MSTRQDRSCRRDWWRWQPPAPTSLGLGEGGRLLSTTDPTTLEGALTTVLAPLVVSGSLVLVSNPDPGRIEEVAGQEQVTARAV
jgi:hypothetical protein